MLFSLTNLLDALTSDPGLLKKHSTHERYFVPGTGYTYPAVRTFYRPHPQGDKLPSKPRAIPLLVFVHGLGGSVAQFHPLLSSLVNVAPCLSIDLPGCGLSRFAPRRWAAYTTEALVQLLAVIVEQHRDTENDQGVILICHSMGCSLGALLASTSSPFSHILSRHVLGLVAICPVAEPPSAKQVSAFRKLLSIPGPIFDLWRQWDRRGGAESASVARFVGKDADLTTRKLQVRFNEQSRTPVWRRMAYGTLPDYSTGEAKGGLPGTAVWAGLKVPLYLAAGAADHITPASNVTKIAEALGRIDVSETEHPFADAEAFDKPTDRLAAFMGDYQPMKNSTASVAVTTGHSLDAEPTKGLILNNKGHQSSLKTTIFPAPASHALPYSTRTARPLSSFIQSFIATAIDPRLSLGWQLQHLCTEGKWDVKNLEKWQGVQDVSTPIAGVFRAMKTLREVDEKHSPACFVEQWSVAGTVTGNEAAGAHEKPPSKEVYNSEGRDGQGAIVCVIDISHESPVYDPRGLEAGGIAYRKFPTVSKLPPTLDEVKNFIDLVDEVRVEFHIDDKAVAAHGHPLIAVHCHYGFNRTGFFIVCYLVERLGWKLQDAIREFAKQRPPGIRHSHFIDELWGRYYEKGDKANND